MARESNGQGRRPARVRITCLCHRGSFSCALRWRGRHRGGGSRERAFIYTYVAPGCAWRTTCSRIPR
eukprot:1544437-Alexandrium_andersonii.AAC.1